MFSIPKIRNCIVVKNTRELLLAKQNELCSYIINENRNKITVFRKHFNKWEKTVYTYFGEVKELDEETTGFMSYQYFYSYCKEEEVNKMKNILKEIPIWESEEQMHFSNLDYAGEDIFSDIYCYDVNSSFTYGVLQLPKGFEKLKEYMLLLYERKKNAKNSLTRSKYKNLQNFLIGYFARIKGFISVRSKIIEESNRNITRKMKEILNSNGVIYLSNTDSIITDYKGSLIMDKYVGEEIGDFKFEGKYSKLKYYSPNCYQLDNKLTYSGVGFFAKKHTDLFKEQYAKQDGKLIEQYDFLLSEDEEYKKICRIKFGKIIVSVFNKLGELLKQIEYKIGD